MNHQIIEKHIQETFKAKRLYSDPKRKEMFISKKEKIDLKRLGEKVQRHEWEVKEYTDYFVISL